jgi:hypothetical protein
MRGVRHASADVSDEARPPAGTVEADETWVGSKRRIRDRANIGSKDSRAGVVSAVERGGELRPVHADRGDGPDESCLYRKVGRLFAGGHDSVKHSVGEYVRGDVHTNTGEGFFSLVKRGMYGTFHSVSKKHLHRYLAELEFRYNARKVDDGERTVLAIQKADGKRFTYREQVGG